jgi:hypothetical protein
MSETDLDAGVCMHQEKLLVENKIERIESTTPPPQGR